MHTKGHAGTEDGDGRAHNAEGGDGCIEGDDRGDNDDDALDGVTDGVCDGIDATQGEEGDLIVKIVESSRKERDFEKGLLRVSSSDGGIPGSLNLKWRFDDE